MVQKHRAGDYSQQDHRFKYIHQRTSKEIQQDDEARAINIELYSKRVEEGFDLWEGTKEVGFRPVEKVFKARLTKEYLTQKLVDEGMSIHQLSKVCDRAFKTIQNYVIKFKIPVKRRQNNVAS